MKMKLIKNDEDNLGNHLTNPNPIQIPVIHL